MNTLYRLYTEERSNIAGIVGRYFKGFTLLEGSGYWLGLGENTIVVEILTDDSASQRQVIAWLAEDIRATNAQHTVIVTEQPVHVSLFTAEGVS